MSLPNSGNYTEIPPYLKEHVNSSTIIINPVNSKTTYSPGDTQIFDYNSGTSGFIDPKSIYICLFCMLVGIGFFHSIV